MSYIWSDEPEAVPAGNSVPPEVWVMFAFIAAVAVIWWMVETW